MRAKGTDRVVSDPDAAMGAALNDARSLAVEISRGIPSSPLDVMTAGLVLAPGETAYRCPGMWLSVHDEGGWTPPSWTDDVVTDQRLVVRCEDGRLLSLNWANVTGLRAALERQHLVINYGDQPPIAFLGAEVAVLAVAAVACVFGVPSLVTHPALAPLRRR